MSVSIINWSDAMKKFLSHCFAVFVRAASAAAAELLPEQGHPDTSGWDKVLGADDLSLAIIDNPKGWIWEAPGTLRSEVQAMLFSKAEYENFIFDLEFKCEKGSNGGVVLYCSEPKNWVPHAVEIQVLDDPSSKPSNITCGAFYGRQTATESAVKPLGDWNHYTITCIGKKIEVRLNGKKVNVIDLECFTSHRNPDGSSAPGFLPASPASLPSRGHIGLQGKHGSGSNWYRNLRIHQLSAVEANELAARLFAASPATPVDPLVSHGAVLYDKLACLSCHGKNLEGGTGPCLTDAVWSRGGSDAEILKTLTDGSSAKGMPAYGALLPEEDRKALLAFIRSRAQGLREIKYSVYDGTWPKLPDFATLKPVKEGSLKDGEVLSLAPGEGLAKFGLVYRGRFLAPSAGKYGFKINSDDGSRLFLDGRLVVDNDGLHPDTQTVRGEAELSAGGHDFELRYMECGGGKSLKIAWSGPLSSGWLTEAPPVTNLVLVSNRARAFRGNLKGQTSARMIAFGLPGGVNCAYDAEHGSFPLAWHGDFINAAGSRLDRGQNYNLPLGPQVEALVAGPLLRLSRADATAPEFLGYKLAGAQVVLHLKLGGARCDQSLEALPGRGLKVRTVFLDPVPGELTVPEAKGGSRKLAAAEAADFTLELPF